MSKSTCRKASEIGSCHMLLLALHSLRCLPAGWAGTWCGEGPSKPSCNMHLSAFLWTLLQSDCPQIHTFLSQTSGRGCVVLDAEQHSTLESNTSVSSTIPFAPHDRYCIGAEQINLKLLINCSASARVHCVQALLFGGYLACTGDPTTQLKLHHPSSRRKVSQIARCQTLNAPEPKLPWLR